ncbi:MAG: phosphoribosylanthranilate isomerase [Gemmatimonadetes bacterium]|uniref:N-(5'-phosphoribosyl)anthranilate isomerase n=1 Tax=Candidatus Kutchimonas denitrificans TaxID=3056748 RepID=A0AAE4ZA28_9BACT|nr:phosphoribosylanthranilate isomerase [Gemmatimonadota bacterium]NIR74321.1 phosphoribosylanthranilate isomerase [Candidatus Kutchimonas denitrificans]NIS01377.1 phosphoribosylanthranilate isomerase [Gemmatimonadota bacterium]NIT67117.1 phosphoribosylanthranilate isomerase [Gemmatimonadota bacterium]NIU52773.1 phosphoribosylanthranilate isomerase [Gemmatimonadota bacterium]
MIVRIINGERSRTRVKICGLTRPEDAARAVELGADALGVVFADSPRQVDIHRAREIFAAAPAYVARVGVFVDPSPDFVADAASRCGIDWVQLSGDETPELARAIDAPVIKAIHVESAADLERAREFPAAAFLLDAPTTDGRKGGTGIAFDWADAERLPWPRDRVIMAGGLRPDNVAQAIRRLRPGGVDVSSGVESEPGIKDAVRLEEFITAVREVDRRIRLAQ